MLYSNNFIQISSDVTAMPLQGLFEETWGPVPCYSYRCRIGRDVCHDWEVRCSNWMTADYVDGRGDSDDGLVQDFLRHCVSKNINSSNVCWDSLTPPTQPPMHVTLPFLPCVPIIWYRVRSPHTYILDVEFERTYSQSLWGRRMSSASHLRWRWGLTRTLCVHWLQNPRDWYLFRNLYLRQNVGTNASSHEIVEVVEYDF